MRRAGSARFEPYFKLQLWEERSAAWKDIQRSFPDAEAAAAACPSGRRGRVMEVSESGRVPVLTIADHS